MGKYAQFITPEDLPAPPQEVQPPIDEDPSSPPPPKTKAEQHEENKSILRAGMVNDFANSAVAGIPQGVSPWSDEAEAAQTGLGNYLGDKAASLVHGLPAGPPLVDEYRAVRDARRKSNADAALLSPAGYGTGVGIGAGVSGLSPIGRVAGAGPVASAALGGASLGLGASEADLTNGEVLPALADTAFGALTAANATMAPTAAVNYVKGASGRQLDRQVDELLTGVMKAKKDKALDTLKRNTGEGIDKNVLATLSDEEIRSAALKDIVQEAGGKAAIKKTVAAEGINLGENPQVLPAIVNAHKRRVGQEIGNYYDGAGSLTPGAPLSDLAKRLDKLAEDAGRGTTKAHAFDSIRDSLLQEFGETNVIKNTGEAHIPLTDLWKQQRQYAQSGYSMEGKYFFNPTERAQIGRQVAAEMKDALQTEFKRVSLRNPSVGSLEELQDANQRFGSLSALEQIAQSKALKEASKSAQSGTMSKLSHAAQLTAALSAVPAGAVAGSLLGHTGLGAAAGSVYGGYLGARAGGRVIDRIAAAAGNRLGDEVVPVAGMAGRLAAPLATAGIAQGLSMRDRATRAYTEHVINPLTKMAAAGAPATEVNKWALANGVPLPLAQGIYADARRKVPGATP